jgi:hypothetical protein
MNTISFAPRWREELVATSADGVLIFEITMGELHVYFPDKTRWLATVPDWAKPQWEIYSEACSNWCKQNKIPLSFVDNALVYEEKDGK